MSSVCKTVCDMCKKTIVNHNVSTTLVLRKYAKLVVTERFGAGPYDYNRRELDLCDTCAKKLERFLSESKVKNEI